MKKRKGFAMIETTVMIVCFFIFIVATIKLLAVIKIKSELNTISNELIRYAEMKGSTDIDSRVKRFKDTMNFDFTVSIEAENSSGNVRLGDTITVVVKTVYDFEVLNLHFPFELSSTRSGISEVYYK